MLKFMPFFEVYVQLEYRVKSSDSFFLIDSECYT